MGLQALGVWRTAYLLPLGRDDQEVCHGRDVACFTKESEGGRSLLRVSGSFGGLNEHLLAYFPELEFGLW